MFAGAVAANPARLGRSLVLVVAGMLSNGCSGDAARSDAAVSAPVIAATETVRPAPSATLVTGGPPGCFEEPVVLDTPPGDAASAQEWASALPQCAQQPQLPLCRFAVARTAFDAGRYARAAPLLLALALEGHEGAVSSTAAELAIDALHLLAMRAKPARLSCWDELEKALPKLDDALCRAPLGTSRVAACNTIRRTGITMRVRRVSRLSLLDDAGQPLSEEECQRVGDEFWAVARDHCLTGNPPGEAHCDDMLFNAHRAYTAGNAPDKAAAARAALLDPKNGLHQSSAARELADSP